MQIRPRFPEWEQQNAYNRPPKHHTPLVWRMEHFQRGIDRSEFPNYHGYFGDDTNHLIQYDGRQPQGLTDHFSLPYRGPYAYTTRHNAPARRVYIDEPPVLPTQAQYPVFTMIRHLTDKNKKRRY